MVAIVFLLICAQLLFGKNHKEWGLTWSQNGEAKKLGIGVAVFKVLVSTGLTVFYFSGIKEGPISDWLYQLTMPGIHEEMYDRGIMLLILTKAFDSTWKFAKVHWNWGAIILTLMFYLTHVVHVNSDWNMVVVWGDFLPGVYGLLLMYIRLGTGSLALPIALHGYLNAIGYLV